MAAGTMVAMVQSQGLGKPGGALPLSVSNTAPIPVLPSPAGSLVLVRVLAVALNPNDHKMVSNFPVPGNGVGCDFCGVVESVGADAAPASSASRIQPGARVCGPMFPYSNDSGAGSTTAAKVTEQQRQFRRLGAFAEWVVADSQLLLEVPEGWTDLQGAALGGVGWSTVALTMSHPTALALGGRPSRPSSDESSPSVAAAAGDAGEPVLVYGGGTATGTMACQLLKLSGYSPIAVTQTEASALLASKYGAARVVSGTEDYDKASSAPIRHVLDCITDAASARCCFDAVARTGGRYACLEHFQDSWRTRRAVKVKEVMGFEVLGWDIDLGGPQSTYTRPADDAAVAAGRLWADEMQSLMDDGALEPHPVQELSAGGEGSTPGGWADAVLEGLSMLQLGKVHGTKLAVRVSGG